MTHFTASFFLLLISFPLLNPRRFLRPSPNGTIYFFGNRRTWALPENAFTLLPLALSFSCEQIPPSVFFPFSPQKALNTVIVFIFRLLRTVFRFLFLVATAPIFSRHAVVVGLSQQDFFSYLRSDFDAVRFSEANLVRHLFSPACLTKLMFPPSPSS